MGHSDSRADGIGLELVEQRTQIQWVKVLDDAFAHTRGIPTELGDVVGCEPTWELPNARCRFRQQITRMPITIFIDPLATRIRQSGRLTMGIGVGIQGLRTGQVAIYV